MNDPIFPDLKNKNILVTGGMRGIGKAISIELAKQGAHVIFNFRSNSDQVEVFKDQLVSLGGKATACQFDQTDYEGTEKAIGDLLGEVGEVHGLVNNAGISKDQLFLRVKAADMDSIIDTNLKGAIWVAKCLSRNFLKVPNGSIVNMSSVVGLMGNTAQSLYASSKAGLIGFTKSLAKEMSSKGLRCNAVCPGFIETEMTKNLEEKAKEAYFSAIPLKRFGKAEEVAKLTLFLLSESSSYITGETFKIDGGLYI